MRFGEEGGESPVEQVDFSKVADHDVGRFDVEMKSAFGVGIIDGITEVEKDV